MPQLALHTPIGDLTVSEEDGAIVALDFGWGSGGQTETPLLRRACEQLHAYFDGELTAFDVPFDLHGTDFQRRCWLALATIPYGQTVSYGEQARRLGLGHDAARAVGAANGQNPVPVILPCHRVVGADGSLTGFGGGLPLKRYLLEHEGALLPLS